MTVEIEALKCESCGASDFEFEGNICRCNYCDMTYILKGGKIDVKTVVHKSDSTGFKIYSCYKNLKLKVAHGVYCEFENSLFVTKNTDLIKLIKKLSLKFTDMPYNQKQVMSEDEWNDWEFQKQEQQKRKNPEAKNWKIKIQ